MRPSQLPSGCKLAITTALGVRTAYFVGRIPAETGAAVNLLRFPDYAGLNGPDDTGISQMSDGDLSRRGEYA